jgi:hypothetical protein
MNWNHNTLIYVINLILINISKHKHVLSNDIKKKQPKTKSNKMPNYSSGRIYCIKSHDNDKKSV